MKPINQLLLAAALLITVTATAQVGVGTNTPNASAVLDVSSTSKGLLPPRMTTAQRDLISSPATGLTIYNTSTGHLEYYNGTAWVGDAVFTHFVGELYGGGVVVSVWKENGVEKGLVVSLTDVSAGSAWSNVTALLIGSTAQSATDGQANTNAIIAQVGHTASGAKLCNDYVSGGFNDWYLPASWELNECFIAAGKVNVVLGSANGFQAGSYLSSTEYSASYAYSKVFNSGTTVGQPKSDVYRVRAVRRF